MTRLGSGPARHRLHSGGCRRGKCQHDGELDRDKCDEWTKRASWGRNLQEGPTFAWRRCHHELCLKRAMTSSHATTSSYQRRGPDWCEGALACDNDSMTQQAKPTFDDVVGALQRSWGLDTCDPHDHEYWHEGNPSRGMCIVSALIVQDYFGGELLEAMVHVEGTQQGYHTWNRLDGVEVDVTRAQFAPDEIVGEPYVVPRITGPDMRMAQQYEILRQRVEAELSARSAS